MDTSTITKEQLLEFGMTDTLFLNCNSIEELKAFEKCIGMWTPVF